MCICVMSSVFLFLLYLEYFMRHVGCGDREGAVLSWLLINRDTSYIYYLLLRILLFSKIVLKTYSIYFHFFL